MIVPTLLAALGLSLVHLFAGKLRFLHGIPRSRWLSAAGGVAVAYVFVHLLPELAEGQTVLERAATEALGFLEHHEYLVALTGLIMFYGLERAAKRSRRQQWEMRAEDTTSPGVFWLHMTSYSVYNGLIGYLLLHRVSPGIISLLLYFMAMGLHFVVSDYGLREDHKQAYTRIGRWIPAFAVVLGWGLGVLIEIPELVSTALVAFLAGGIVLNVLKEELPKERESRFSAFVLGSVGYAALLIALSKQ